MVGEDEKWVLGALQPVPLMPTSAPGAPDRKHHSSSLQETVFLSNMHMDTISVDYLDVGTEQPPHLHLKRPHCRVFTYYAQFVGVS
jgi:hypothetical protein